MVSKKSKNMQGVPCINMKEMELSLLYYLVLGVCNTVPFKKIVTGKWPGTYQNHNILNFRAVPSCTELCQVFTNVAPSDKLFEFTQVLIKKNPKIGNIEIKKTKQKGKCYSQRGLLTYKRTAIAIQQWKHLAKTN